jgi:putative transposase
MPEYRRAWLTGGTFFFTLVTNQRRMIFNETKARQILREAFQYGMMKAGQFHINALCLLPDHLHCIWTLPENDKDYSTRWKVIKAYFSHQYLQRCGVPGARTSSKIIKGEVGVWQRRFWEQIIRDENDLNHHIEYIHYNPVKHGLVQSVKAWPWSTFHRYVREGFYEADWGAAETNGTDFDFGE